MDIIWLLERAEAAEESDRRANRTATLAAVGGGVVELVAVRVALATAGAGLGVLIW